MYQMFAEIATKKNTFHDRRLPRFTSISSATNTLPE
jgi:hypothetical protein